MTEISPATRRGGSGTVFGLVIGLVLGVLVAELVVPKHGTTVQTSAGTRRGAGAAAGTAGDLGAGGGSVAGDAGGAGSTAAGGATAGGGVGTTGAGATGGGGAGATGAAGAPGGGGRGITPTAITVGVAYADLSALKSLGPEYDNGDVPKQWNALHDGWVKHGQLPVNGRDIHFVYHKYNVLDLSDQRKACASFIQDDKAFAVVGVAYFQVGSDCVAGEFHTPLITSDGPDEDTIARDSPWLFSLDMSTSRLLRNFVHWADGRGLLKGRKIGIYYQNDAVTTGLMNKDVKGELGKLGYRITAEHSSSPSEGNGGPQDAVAVQKFQTRGVDLVMLFTSKTGFLQAAAAQHYKPTYVDSDYLYGTSDTAGSTYPADEYDGTFGMTGEWRGDSAAGKPLTPAQEACEANYEQQTGTKVARPGRSGHGSAEFGYILFSCSEGDVLLRALQAAGAGVNAPSFVSQIEAIKGYQVPYFPSLTFAANKHDGADLQRTVQWQKRCTCWTAVSDFSPLFVP